MHKTDQAIRLGHLILQFGMVARATYHPDGITSESDTTHTVMLSLIACELCPRNLDRGMVAQMALVHDLVEALAGDTNTLGITSDGRLAKEAREEAAMVELRDQYRNSWFVDMIESYERQDCRESRYVRYLDKAMPKITHALNGGAAIALHDMSPDQLEAEHRDQLAQLNRTYPNVHPAIKRLMVDLMHISEVKYRINFNRITAKKEMALGHQWVDGPDGALYHCSVCGISKVADHDGYTCATWTRRAKKEARTMEDTYPEWRFYQIGGARRVHLGRDGPLCGVWRGELHEWGESYPATNVCPQCRSLSKDC